MYEIIARLCFMRIDDSRRPHLKVALGLFQLLANRLELGYSRLQIYFREQDVEICLRHAQDQVLRSDDELRVRLRNLYFGLLINREIFLAENRLGGSDRNALVINGDARRANDGSHSNPKLIRVLDVDKLPPAHERERNRGKQAGPTLR